LVLGSDYFYSTEQVQKILNNKHAPGSPPWSPARGGFSVGWGASALPPAPGDVDEWPITHDEILRNMRSVLSDIPVSEPEDELGDVLGRLSPRGSRVLGLSKGQVMLLDRLSKARERGGGRTVLVGQSRLLTQANTTSLQACRHCGYCNAGCVYGSIYTAEQHIDRWVNEGRIDYRADCIVTSIDESGNAVRILVEHDGKSEVFEADRLYLAAGAVNSARILLASSRGAMKSVVIRRTGYSLQIFASVRGLDISWPESNTQTSHFLVFRDESLSPYWAHVQIGQPNELLLGRLGVKHENAGSLVGKTTRSVAGRMISAAMNLHSSLGPTYEIRLASGSDSAIGMRPLETCQSWSRESRAVVNAHVRILRGILRSARFYALPFARQNPNAAQSHHLGASFPMGANPKATTDTDVLGRPFGWSRIHVVDTSVLPAIPATTIGLLTMANAHRIAAQSIAL
jgi:choline dehydrogenase-like flavoprotein